MVNISLIKNITEIPELRNFLVIGCDKLLNQLGSNINPDPNLRFGEGIM